jgi:hypothetical protein
VVFGHKIIFVTKYPNHCRTKRLAIALFCSDTKYNLSSEDSIMFRFILKTLATVAVMLIGLSPWAPTALATLPGRPDLVANTLTCHLPTTIIAHAGISQLPRSLRVRQALPNAPQAPTALQVFVVNLDGGKQVPPVTTPATAYGVFVLAADGSTLAYRLFANGFINTITTSHIHAGASGVNGGVVTSLVSPTNSTPSTGTVTLTPTQVTDLSAGNLYVNVHTNVNPGGEVRGQLLAANMPTQFSAIIDGGQEVPATNSQAAGIAQLTLNGSLDTLSYALAVGNLPSVDITAAHIHTNAAGSSGGVWHTINTTGLGSGSSITGSTAVGASDLVNLLTDYLYINIHTATNPGGMIRGQITAQQNHLWLANLSPANEPTPVLNSEASSQAWVGLDTKNLQLSWRVRVQNIVSPTAAHIHATAGGVLVSLNSGMFGNTQPAVGNSIVTLTQAADIVANSYVNVHTTSNPSGELRGWLQRYQPSANEREFLAGLVGSDEVPAVMSAASGVGYFSVSADLAQLQYNLHVANIGTTTAAHIHQAETGQNGIPVHTIYAGSGLFDASNPRSGNLAMTAAQVVDLFSGAWYINIHTSTNPAGEIRGQVGRVQVFMAHLSGNQEVPANASTGQGSATFVVNARGNVLAYRLFASGLGVISAAHIHQGLVGTNGGVLVGLYSGVGTFDGNTPFTNNVSLNTATLLDMLGGRTYANIHTAAFPGGELRGQIQRYTSPQNWQAYLRGAAEVPAVNSIATGMARFTLNHDASSLHYLLRVDANATNLTAAHIHAAPSGQNGGVADVLYNGAGGLRCDPSERWCGAARSSPVA